jgi:hypothetical protein
MDYEAYKFQRFKRKKSFFLIFVLILIIAVSAGIGALYLRGFSFNSNPNAESVTTQELEFWVVKVRDFDKKMDAFSHALTARNKGSAEFVLQEDEHWSAIEGVYAASADANAELMKPDVTKTAVAERYIIASKTLGKPDAEIFNELKTVGEILMSIRGKTEREVAAAANELYGNLKPKSHNINAAAAMLSLHNLISTGEVGGRFLSVLNTAIATVIFSLDNF